MDVGQDVRRPHLSHVVRPAVLFAVASAAVLVADVAMLSLPRLLGSDWTWYADGPNRLLKGLPLYDPRMLRGSFDYVAPGVPPLWNQAPWAVVPFVPFALLGEPVGRVVWLLATDLALVAALALSWPASLSKPTQLLLAALLVLTAPVLMALSWGNFQAWTLLGVAVFWAGRERGSEWVEAAGITLAAVKLLPALPLVLFVVVRDRNPRPLLMASVALLLLVLPAIALAGSRILPDFIVTQLNIAQVTSKNLAPSLWLSGVADPVVVAGIVRALSLAAMLTAVLRINSDEAALFVALLAACILTTNLYADWLTLPLLGALLYLRSTTAHPPPKLPPAKFASGG